jgi:carbon monoxide dehydrogenase subunit G
MAWVKGKEDRSFIVDAPYDDVVEFFCEPANFRAAFSQMEQSEEIEEGVWHWTLQEKSEKGVRFQGIYTVEYQRDGDSIEWATREGNMKSSGSTRFDDLDGTTRVHYEETLEVDLPIPRLMAKVFKPIVSREVSGGIGDFLDEAKSILEERA